MAGLHELLLYSLSADIAMLCKFTRETDWKEQFFNLPFIFKEKISLFKNKKPPFYKQKPVIIIKKKTAVITGQLVSDYWPAYNDARGLGVMIVSSQ